MFAIGTAFTACIGTWIARRLDRAMRALERDSWLHSRYSPESRAAWIAVQVERMTAYPPQKRAWRNLVWICLAVVASTLLFCDGSLAFRAAWGLGSCALIVGLVESAVLEARRAPAKLEWRMRAAAPDVYFGHDGIVCDDRLIVWADAGQYFTRAFMDQRPPRSMTCNFEKIVPGAYTGPQMVTLSQAVLTPETATASDQCLLQAALGSRCPSAQVQLLP